MGPASVITDIACLLEAPVPLLQHTDRIVDGPVVQGMQVPQVQIMSGQGTQTSTSLGTASVRHVNSAEIVEVEEFGPPVPCRFCSDVCDDNRG